MGSVGGGSAPPPPPGPAPPPPPPVQAPVPVSSGGSDSDGRAALFSQLNQGAGVTAGITIFYFFVASKYEGVVFLARKTWLLG